MKNAKKKNRAVKERINKVRIDLDLPRDGAPVDVIETLRELAEFVASDLYRNEDSWYEIVDLNLHGVDIRYENLHDEDLKVA